MEPAATPANAGAGPAPDPSRSSGPPEPSPKRRSRHRPTSLRDPVPKPTLADVLDAVSSGEVDLGFLPIENSIEGTVSATVDSLVFEVDLLIQREVVLDVHLNLVAPPGTRCTSIRRVLSFPHATAQCRRFLSGEPARLSRSWPPTRPRRRPGSSARSVVRTWPPSHRGSRPSSTGSRSSQQPSRTIRTTRPGSSLSRRRGVPGPTGHDKTSIVCFQREDHPGTLHAILSEFSARSINLTKLESRPTKRGLGNYCFIIDLEGHIADEVVADALRVLHAELAGREVPGLVPGRRIRGRRRTSEGRRRPGARPRTGWTPRESDRPVSDPEALLTAATSSAVPSRSEGWQSGLMRGS